VCVACTTASMTDCTAGNCPQHYWNTAGTGTCDPCCPTGVSYWDNLGTCDGATGCLPCTGCAGATPYQTAACSPVGANTQNRACLSHCETMRFLGGKLGNTVWTGQVCPVGCSSFANAICSGGVLAGINDASGGSAWAGTIPSELTLFASTFAQLRIESRSLTGTLPTELGILTKLTQIILPGNALQGTIPTELGLLPTTGTPFSKFDITGSANVQGSIPDELASLSSLVTLFVKNTAISGTIPNVRAALNSCDINFDGTTMCGTIPIHWTSSGAAALPVAVCPCL